MEVLQNAHVIICYGDLVVSVDEEGVSAAGVAVVVAHGGDKEGESVDDAEPSSGDVQ